MSATQNSGAGAPRYEMRFEIPVTGLTSMKFVRRRVSDPPRDNTVCHVDAGDENGYSHQPVAAIYKDGEWSAGNGRPLKITPLFWTEMDGLAATGE